MQGESRVQRRHLTRSRRNVALATAIAAVSTLAATAGGRPVSGRAPEDDVAEWFDEVDPAMVVDKSADCMAGTTETVFYRGDRIVMRPTTTMSDADVKDGREHRPERHLRRPGVDVGDHGGADRVPAAASGPAIKPVLSVSLSRAVRCGAASTSWNWLAPLRHEPGIRDVARLRPHAVDAVQLLLAARVSHDRSPALTPPRDERHERRAAGRHRGHGRGVRRRPRATCARRVAQRDHAGLGRQRADRHERRRDRRLPGQRARAGDRRA